MAMLEHLDRGIGSVVGKLKDEGLFDNTLVFFLTDNGGSKAMSADNTPLRGFKQNLFEGGIRTPFSVSWPARFEGGRSIDTPVISLDILPTVLDAVGVRPPTDTAFDGKSLLPLIAGTTKEHHETLYWSEGGDSGEWAVRHGDWKLWVMKNDRGLFDLAKDPGEAKNVAAEHPEKVAELTALYDAWLEPMPNSVKGDPKRWGQSAKPGAPGKKPPLTEREKIREQRRQEKLKAKAAKKAAKKGRNEAPDERDDGGAPRPGENLRSAS